MKDIPRVQKLNMNMSLAKSILGFRDRSRALIFLISLNSLGTERQGAVRFSFGWFNTEHEIDTAIHAVKELAE